MSITVNGVVGKVRTGMMKFGRIKKSDLLKKVCYKQETRYNEWKPEEVDAIDAIGGVWSNQERTSIPGSGFSGKGLGPQGLPLGGSGDSVDGRVSVKGAKRTGSEAALDMLRKVVGIGVRCFENHGCPKRE